MRLRTLMVVACFFTVAACGEQPDDQTAEREGSGEASPRVSEGGPNPLDLPQRLHQLLRQEMAQVEAAMMQLQSHLARGRRDEAAATARRIHESFILKQKLTKQELQELQSRLSDAFLKRDRSFHREAKKLAEAAENGRFMEAAKHFGTMTEACVACHREHAAERFPGLVPPSNAGEAEPATD